MGPEHTGEGGSVAMPPRSVQKRMEDLALTVTMIDQSVESGDSWKDCDLRMWLVDGELRKLADESARYWFALALHKRLKEMTTNGKT